MDIKGKFKELIAKIKTIKNIEIVIAVVIIAVVALIYSSAGSDSGCGKSCSSAEGTATTESTATEASEQELEEKLADILSKISGAGQVSVLITYESSSEKVTAATTNSHSTVTSGANSGSTTTTETSTPLVVNQDVVVLKEILPEVKGVIVVAEGADDVKVKMSLLQAVQTALNVDANAIEIFAGK